MKEDQYSTKSFICLYFLTISVLQGWTNPAHANNTKQTFEGKQYALLIGIDDYSNSPFKSLLGAKNDITLIKTILINRFQFKDANITVLTDKEATHTAIRNQFQKLAQTVKFGDQVYIHYSGHGSSACDLNDDEKIGAGLDSTWTPYGARTHDQAQPMARDCIELRQMAAKAKLAPLTDDLDHYDILDDEINMWLDAIGRRTPFLIFVSDSCHSGTIVRGSRKPLTRGVPTDLRLHPVGLQPFTPQPLKGLRLSACRDDESAGEHQAGHQTYGMFTWFWAQSLTQASPGATWAELLRQTRARLYYHGARQHPQMEGDAQLTVFKGRFARHPPTIAVKYVTYDGQTAHLDAGELVGVTRGSLYRQYNFSGQERGGATITITAVTPFQSQGVVKGAFNAGQLVTLDRYAAPSDPLRICMTTLSEKDQPLANRIKAKIQALSAFKVMRETRDCDWRLSIFRPKTDANPTGEASPHCRILSTHHPSHPWGSTIALQDQGAGIAKLISSLYQLARVKRLTTLTSPPHQPDPIGFQISIWRHAHESESEKTMHASGRVWKREKQLQIGLLTETEISTERLLTFEVENKGRLPYFIYLVNVTGQAEIKPFYPLRHQNREHGKFSPGDTRAIQSVALLLDQPGREYVRMIASREPIDIYLLQQPPYRMRSSAGGLNSLENFLTIASGWRSAASDDDRVNADWCTLQGVFAVKPETKPKKQTTTFK